MYVLKVVLRLKIIMQEVTVFDRFHEPSTYGGIAAVIMAVQSALQAGDVPTAVGAGVAGALAMFMPERTRRD